MLISPFKETIIKDRVALITGGGSGIGLEIARQFGLHGAKIAIMGRRKDVLETAVKSLESENIPAMFVQGDVRDEKSCEQVVSNVIAKYGRLDILVNNAAGNFLATLDDLTPKGFKTVIEIDLMGVFNMSHACFPHLKQAKNGSIINISATLYYQATWYQSHASAAKAGIDSLTRSFALEWGTYGIRTNSIAPGPIADTAGLTKLAPSTDDEFTKKMIAKSIPLKRIPTKFDIAMASLFLVSNAGFNVTGDCLIVDGGQWLFQPPAIPRDMVSQMSRGVEKKSRAVGIAKNEEGGKTSKL